MAPVDPIDLVDEKRASEARVIRDCIEKGVCPWCGAGPFTLLALHTWHKHRIDGDGIRDRALLYHSASICSKEHSEYCRQRAIDEDRAAKLPTGARPGYKLSEAARLRLETVAAPARRKPHSETRKANLAAAMRKRWSEATPEQRAEWGRAATEPLKRHGIGAYHRGCRCDVCRAAMSVANKRHRENAKARLLQEARESQAVAPTPHAEIERAVTA